VNRHNHTTHIRWLDRLHSIEASAWDRLHDGSNPFISHAFLAGLEQYGCLREQWGWQAQHLTLWRDGNLVGAVPGYLKSNSHGEFVFDHAWAQAYARFGIPYYPKWLGAVPYSPVSGPRLLAATAADQLILLRAITAKAHTLGLSSAHINFHTSDESALFDLSQPSPWLARSAIQYHWSNPGHWHTFDDFLVDLDHKRRKNIRSERTKIARSGLDFCVLHGHEASAADLRAVHEFYLQTFIERGNAPSLTLEFLHHLAASMPQQLVLFIAKRNRQPIAGAICLRGKDTLYGRYWGGEAVKFLHFETCYYQGIDYCLREGLHRFEPGAGGEHKLVRGFLPTTVYSHHWIADPEIRPILHHWCAQETEAMKRYKQIISPHAHLTDYTNQKFSV